MEQVMEHQGGRLWGLQMMCRTIMQNCHGDGQVSGCSDGAILMAVVSVWFVIDGAAKNVKDHQQFSLGFVVNI